MKYRKKPVVVEAIQYTKDNLLDVMEFCDGGKKTIFNHYLYIVTLEGNMRVRKGDYIIRGVHGEYYPCEKSIFEETYEAVNMNDDHVSIKPEKPFFKTYSEEPTLENTEDGDMVWYKDELYIRSGDMILIPQKLNRI